MEERIFKELARLFTITIIWGFIMWSFNLFVLDNIENDIQVKLDKIEKSIKETSHGK